MIKGKATCRDFECIGDQYGICIYGGDCEGETCIFWQDCSKCQCNLVCC